MDVLVGPMQPDLGRWQARNFNPGVAAGPQPGDLLGCYERTVAWEGAGRPGPVCRRLAEAIFAFDIFGPALVTPILNRVPVELGHTVGVLYHFLPGVRLFFAGRVVACFDEEQAGLWRCGFTYRTLTGHPACGEETFSVEKDMQTGRVQVALRSWSHPALLLARLGGPVMRQVQRRAALAALDHLAELAAPSRTAPLRRNLRTGLLRAGGPFDGGP